MPKFFIPELPDDRYILTGPDARHISYSLRMKPGDGIVLCDGKGTDCRCIIDEITKDSVCLSVISKEKNPCEDGRKITVYQAMIKPDKFEEVIRKSTEFGAAEIVPLITDRCEYTFRGKDITGKLERWNKISEESAKQCGRGIIPKVTAPEEFSSLKTEDRFWIFCYEKSTVPMKDTVREAAECSDIAIVVGPEGGFAECEVKEASEKGMKEVSLGKRILRSESAAPFVLACLSYEKNS